MLSVFPAAPIKIISKDLNLKQEYANNHDTSRYPIWLVIGRYIDYWPIIGFADIENSYRYRLSVSADKKPHIRNLTDMLNHMWL